MLLLMYMYICVFASRYSNNHNTQIITYSRSAEGGAFSCGGGGAAAASDGDPRHAPDDDGASFLVFSIFVTSDATLVGMRTMAVVVAVPPVRGSSASASPFFSSASASLVAVPAKRNR